MRIAVDARMLGHSGIGRYLRELLRSWGENPRVRALLALGPPPQLWASLSAPAHFRSLPYRAPVYSIREQVTGLLLLKSHRLAWDVAFFPHFNAPVWSPRPTVVTIHDLIHLRYPEFFGFRRVTGMRIVLSRVLKRAARIITDSKTTRDDVVDLFPGLAARVRTVPLGVSPTFRRLPGHEVTAYLSKLGQLRPYVLFLGNFKRFKNLATLVRAFARLSSEHPDLDLIVAGRPFGEHDVLRSMIQSTGLAARVREIVDAPDGDLVSLLNGAKLLVQPSLYEGFGLPVLEAMACGAPVIVSDTPALREVAGGAAAVYGSPTNAEALAAAIGKVLENSSYAETLRGLGRARAAHFTWAAASSATLDVLAEACADARHG